MAIQFVGQNKSSAINTSPLSCSLTSLSGGISSQVSEGDFVIVVVDLMKSSSVAYPPSISTSGYSQIASLYSSGSYDNNLLVGYKFMGSTPDSNVTVTGNTSNTALKISVYVWRGVNSSTPLDVTSTTATGGNSAIPNPPSITPTTSNSVIIAIGGNGYADNYYWINGTSSGYSNSSINNNIETSSFACSIGICSKVWSGSGAEDPGIFSTNIGDYGAATWGAVTLALRPAPVVGPANLKSYNTNLKANIKTINTNPIANVKSLDTNV